MDNPVFKLEGVVHERSAEALQDFEGPLDLILFLLSKNKIEIQDIPIALIWTSTLRISSSESSSISRSRANSSRWRHI